MKLLQLSPFQCGHRMTALGRNCRRNTGLGDVHCILMASGNCTSIEPTQAEGCSSVEPSSTATSVSRRSALLASATALGLAIHGGVAVAEELEGVPSVAAEPAKAAAGKQAYFDFTVDGKPAGRVVVELYDDVALGAARFSDLVQGKEGVGYRRSRINLLQDGYIQDAGVKSLSYTGSGRVPIAGGEDIDLLEDELELRRHSHGAAGAVSLVVRNRKERASKDRLVARDGQLITVTEVAGELPNGTAFAITTQPQPELDETNLVVGRVVSGSEVVAALTRLPRVKDNSDSPFFKAGKLSGDKRADVAERAFGKPFARIFVSECGLL